MSLVPAAAGAAGPHQEETARRGLPADDRSEPAVAVRPGGQSAQHVLLVEHFSAH